jgi:hypothetical protein
MDPLTPSGFPEHIQEKVAPKIFESCVMQATAR